MQGIHFNNLTELNTASEALADTLLAQRPLLPQRFYWKETTTQHYTTPHGEAKSECICRGQRLPKGLAISL